jgi:hypothetical protein
MYEPDHIVKLIAAIGPRAFRSGAHNVWRAFVIDNRRLSTDRLMRAAAVSSATVAVMSLH